MPQTTTYTAPEADSKEHYSFRSAHKEVGIEDGSDYFAGHPEAEKAFVEKSKYIMDRLGIPNGL